jgi:hypothetical protein
MPSLDKALRKASCFVALGQPSGGTHAPNHANECAFDDIEERFVRSDDCWNEHRGSSGRTRHDAEGNPLKGVSSQEAKAPTRAWTDSPD